MFQNKGLELWEEALNVIPGGNFLLSKNKNFFSPGKWPCYYKKAKGCHVWDLDGKKYLDFSTNGVGACSLGHGSRVVDASVHKMIKRGVMSTLNSPYEVFLAKKLIELDENLNMVKFARTGGEANAISIRIARAFTGKSKIAICGYHGWHDWYVSTNICSKDALNDHLLKGIGAKGVPLELEGTTIPFKYNSFEDLQILKNTNDIAAIKMEVTRNEKPKKNYLETIRQICDEKGIILIFDECTSGFREAYGGVYKNFGITPDIIILGKALGNGYAITAIQGKEKYMKSACETFISSTFWTEAIGPVAALSTLNEMKKQKSWQKLPKIGKSVKDIWKKNAEKYNLPICINGLDALPTFYFNTKDKQAYQTFFVEKMLDFGFLASNAFYPTTSHTKKDIFLYGKAIEKVFNEISYFYENKINVKEFCEGEISTPTFKRLN